MTDKLKLEDIDWSEAPVDAEAAYIWGEGNVGYYKFNAKGRFMYKSTPEGLWKVGCGSPSYKPIKRPSNIFTKSMLVAGKHIVETGEVFNNTYLITILDNGHVILENSSGYLDLDDYNEDLTVLNGDSGAGKFDIVKIYTRTSSEKVELKLIWERTPSKVPTQKEL